MKQNTKTVRANDGHPHDRRVCLTTKPSFTKGFCDTCGWHARFHAKTSRGDHNPTPPSESTMSCN